MAVTTYFILFGLVHLSHGEDCVMDNTPQHIRWEKQLRKDLKCHENLYVQPKPVNKTMSVHLRFTLRYFTFSSDEEVFTMQTWMFISWTDERLKWDPENYGGINETHVSSASIWAPSFLLFNSADSDDFDRFFYIRCHLKNTGAVLCIPRIVHNTRCSVNLTDFPYDVQECTVQYGAWSTNNQSFDINVNSRAITMWGAEYGSQWMITDYRQASKLGSAIQLNMTFVLEREALGLAAVIVYPSLILSGLTIACLFLDVRSTVRLGLVCFSILCHHFWLTEVGRNIPKATAYLPRILMYYRGSMILTGVLLAITFILGALCKRRTASHNIIISINDYVYKSYVQFLVYPRWDFDDTVITDENKFLGDWVKFANVVNSLCAIVMLFAYIGMYFAFVPQPIPLTFN